MRLFIGIELPEDVARAAADAAGRLRDSIERAADRAVLRWVPRENLHLTLWFIGEVTDAAAADIQRTIAAPFTERAFALQIGGGGVFPPSGPPRAIWLGLQSGTASLVALHRELAVRLAPLGFVPEKRPYSPHLTIARVKDLRGRDGVAVRGVLAAAPGEIASCTVSHLTLLRSHTSPKGSRYEALLRVPLG
jgi:2'-5' RNA ligase